MKKKIITLIMSVCIMLTLFPNCIVSAAQTSISGKIRYLSYGQGSSSPNKSVKPLNNFSVEVHYWADGKNKQVEYTKTNNSGEFSVTVTVNDMSTLKAAYIVKAEDEASYIVESFADISNPGEIVQTIPVYINATKNQFDTYEPLRFPDKTISCDGSFNIVKTVREGYDYWLKIMPGVTPKKIPIILGASNYLFSNTSEPPLHMYIDGHRDEYDQYDKSTILHEYGHILMRMYSKYPLPTGRHTSDNYFPKRLNMTFSEGFATFFAQSVIGNPRFQDVYYGSNKNVKSKNYSVETPGSNYKWSMGIGNELWNAAVLWDIVDSYSLLESWDNYQTNTKTVIDVLNKTLQKTGYVFTGTQNESNGNLKDFWETWFDNGYIEKNSKTAYDFWRLFYNNGMQFDNEPPKVEITKKVLGNLKTPTTLTFKVTDNIKVQKAEIYVDEVLKRTIQTPDANPVSYTINPKDYPDGKHIIAIKAYDYAGNELTIPSKTATSSSTQSFSDNGGVTVFADADANEDQVEILDPKIYREDFSLNYASFSANSDFKVGVIYESRNEFGYALNQLGIPFDRLNADWSGYTYEDIKDYDAIFISCTENGLAHGTEYKELIKEYVDNGGYLFTSCLSYGYFKDAFPNKINFRDPPPTGNMAIGWESILDAGLRIVIGEPALGIYFAKRHWPPATSVGGDTKLYMTGSLLLDPASEDDFTPIPGFADVPYLASFDSGNGKVFYSAYHNDDQSSPSGNGVEDYILTRTLKDILNYLVFVPLKNRIIDEPEVEVQSFSLTSTVAPGSGTSLGYITEETVSQTLKPGETSNEYTFTPAPGFEYAVLNNSLLGDFLIKLTDPNGKSYLNKIDTDIDLDADVIPFGSTGIRITNPTEGKWRYTVTSSIDMPEEAAFSVSIGTKPSIPQITDIVYGDNYIDIKGESFAPLVKIKSHLLDLEKEATTSNGRFTIRVTDVADGYYYFKAVAVSEGEVESEPKTFGFEVNTKNPAIEIDENFSQLYFGSTVNFYGKTYNCKNVSIKLNGEEFGNITTTEEGLDTAGFNLDLNLVEGDNEVVVTGTNLLDKKAVETLTIKSDTSTPDNTKTTPEISEISILDGTDISEKTTIELSVLNGDKDDTKVNITAFPDFSEIAKTNNANNANNANNGKFTFEIDPTNFENGNMEFRIEAINKWGNSDYSYLSVNIINGQNPEAVVSAPTANVPTGEFTGSIAVTLGSDTPDSIIYYTIDGTDPTLESPIYTEPIIIGQTTTIKAFGTKDGYENSDIVTFIYTKKTSSGSSSGNSSVSPPTVSIKAGEIVKNTIITLSTTYQNAKIYYTTDGTTPTKNSAEYTTPIVIDKDITIKAVVIDNNRPSSVITSSYKVRAAKIAFKDRANEIRYIKAYEDNTFKPDVAVTRYEMLESLYNLLDIEKVITNKTFSDLDETKKNMVLDFANIGIIDGFEDKTFRGDQGLTRAEFVKIMSIVLQTKFTDGEIEANKFSDTTEHWAKIYIDAFEKLGYLKGYEDGTFRPDNKMSRAEFTAIVNRIIGVTKVEQSEIFTDLDKNHWAYLDIMNVYTK